jgi:hypothetical protein
VLLVNVQLSKVGEESQQFIPPPELAVLFVNVQFFKVGEEDKQYTPPPWLPSPSATVNPSSTDPFPSPLLKVTTVPA